METLNLKADRLPDYIKASLLDAHSTYSACIDAHRDPLGMRAAAIAADAQLRVIGIPAVRS